MNENTKFDYYYGIEADQFSFYRVPRLLIKDERFKGLSSDAKLLYLCLWKVKQCGKEYCKKGLDNLLNTHNLWISSAGRIGGQEENIDEDADTNLQRVYSFLDIESIDTLQDLFIRILIVFMLSDKTFNSSK